MAQIWEVVAEPGDALGLAFASVPPGPVVVEVATVGQWGARAGIANGDRIVKLNGTIADTLEIEVFKAAIQARPLRLELHRKPHLGKAAGEANRPQQPAAQPSDGLGAPSRDAVAKGEVEEDVEALRAMLAKTEAAIRAARGQTVEEVRALQRDVTELTGGSEQLEQGARALQKDVRRFDQSEGVLRETEAELVAIRSAEDEVRREERADAQASESRLVTSKLEEHDQFNDSSRLKLQGGADLEVHYQNEVYDLETELEREETALDSALESEHHLSELQVHVASEEREHLARLADVESRLKKNEAEAKGAAAAVVAATAALLASTDAAGAAESERRAAAVAAEHQAKAEFEFCKAELPEMRRAINETAEALKSGAEREGNLSIEERRVRLELDSESQAQREFENRLRPEIHAML